MHIHPSLNQLFGKSTRDLNWIQQTMPNNNSKFSQVQEIDKFQNDLDHLFYEWNTINIVLESIRNAFTITQDSSEEHLDQVDKELSIAYDDLMAQVRHLDRRLSKMTLQVNRQKLLQQPPPNH